MEHESQLEAPGEPWNFPWAQLEQELASPPEYLPTAHTEHEVASPEPWLESYSPAEQDSHDEAPVAGWYLPERQLVQLEAPELEYLPAEHRSEQAVDRPGEASYVPALHREHDDDPVVSS